MSEFHSPDERARMLREYILGTGESEEMEIVRRRLAESADWEQAFAREQESLKLLDLLPTETPARDLTAAVLERLGGAGAVPARPWGSRRWALQFAAAAAMVALVAAVIMPALSRSREASRRASVQNNLKQLGVVFKMYANESKGEAYPPLTPYEGFWMFDVAAVYPKYFTDLSILVDPTLPDAGKLVDELNRLARMEPVDWEGITRIAARSYTYTGYAVESEADVRAVMEQRRLMARADLSNDVTSGTATVHRLREGVERFFLSDINNPAASARAQVTIPVLVTTPRSERVRTGPDGAHVLYMDGHVGFVKKDEAFPVQERVLELFGHPD